MEEVAARLGEAVRTTRRQRNPLQRSKSGESSSSAKQHHNAEDDEPRHSTREGKKKTGGGGAKNHHAKKKKNNTVKVVTPNGGHRQQQQQRGDNSRGDAVVVAAVVAAAVVADEPARQQQQHPQQKGKGSPRRPARNKRTRQEDDKRKKEPHRVTPPPSAKASSDEEPHHQQQQRRPLSSRRDEDVPVDLPLRQHEETDDSSDDATAVVSLPTPKSSSLLGGGGAASTAASSDRRQHPLRAPGRVVRQDSTGSVASSDVSTYNPPRFGSPLLRPSSQPDLVRQHQPPSRSYHEAYAHSRRAISMESHFFEPSPSPPMSRGGTPNSVVSGFLQAEAFFAYAQPNRGPAQDDVSVTFSAVPPPEPEDPDAEEDRLIARHLQHVYARADYLLREHAARANGEPFPVPPPLPSFFHEHHPSKRNNVVVVPGGFVATTTTTSYHNGADHHRHVVDEFVGGCNELPRSHRDDVRSPLAPPSVTSFPPPRDFHRKPHFHPSVLARNRFFPKPPPSDVTYHQFP